VVHGREQWRLFFEQGRFDKRLNSRTGYELVGTSFGQMIRHQVVAVLASFMANRANDFRAYVQQLRGWLQSEIGRVLNRLVDTHAPAAIATELLDFRAHGPASEAARETHRHEGSCRRSAMVQSLLQGMDYRGRFTGYPLSGLGPARVSPQGPPEPRFQQRHAKRKAPGAHEQSLRLGLHAIRWRSGLSP
jgi:hypothetical protein